MKKKNISQKTKSVLTIATVLLAAISALPAAEYYWNAASGLLPNQVEASMVLYDNAVPEDPVLTNGALFLSTDTYSENMYYLQDAPSLDMPASNLVIEAELKFVSGVSSRAGRAPVMIGARTAPYVSGMLCIEQDSISLSRDSGVSGPTATVDTDDAFHIYRIEVDDTTTAGTPIRVYQDGVLQLTDTLVGSGANVSPEVDIWFGEGTEWAYGQSLWKSFKHNAAREVIRAPAASIRVSQVEVYWNSYSNHLYNVQYRSELTTNQWTDLFPTNILATNSETSVYDDIPRGRPQRFYRVLEAP